MIRNLAITTPILGTIRLGDVAVNASGKRYPVRANHFKITAPFKDNESHWVEHPMHQQVAETTNQKPDRITEIPIRLMFNNPDLNMRARYEAFNNKGRIVCAGDGENARRLDGDKVIAVTCPGAEYCEFGRQVKCDLFARLNVTIDGQDDEFSSFILRTESVNAVKTLYAKMKRMSAMFGNRLVGIPFKLKLRQKASAQSMWTKFWYADLILNGIDKFEAVKLATEYEQKMEEMGLCQSEMEQEALAGLQNGAFEDGMEDFEDLEAFLLARDLDADDAPPEGEITTSQPPTTTATGIAALREWLGEAQDAGALTLNLTKEIGEPAHA